MKRWDSWLVSLVIMVAASSAFAQAPVLSTVAAPYPALQSQVQMAGKTYGPGSVAYGSAGTPLVLSGSGFGDNGGVWFIAYKNGTADTNVQPVQAAVTLWTASQIFLKVPPNAVSGIVEVISGGVVSNDLPFVVTPGTYSSTCPAGPTPNQLQITTDSLSSGAANVSYSAQLKATGGSNSYTWSLVSGSLPSGLSLSSAGVISGTPTSAGSAVSFTVQVVDTSTPQQHDEATLSLQVAGQQEASSSASLYSFSIQSSGGGSEGYDAVGNVTGYTDSVNGSWSFTYDSLNRLATAAGSQDNNPYPNYCWQYDSFGNRLAQSSSSTAYSSSSGGANSCPSGSGSQSSASYNANNQISDGLHQYDAAGDLTQDATAGNSYLYDGEGRVCAVRQSIVGLALMTQYLYDAEGHRVAKGSISTFSCDTTTNGFTATTVYVLGPSGEQMTEMANNSGAWQWAHTNVYAPGLSATYDADLTGQTEGKMYFHLSDWLGTRRQQTDYAGNPVLNFTGLPYGDGLATIPVSNTDAADATEHHFTAKERDTESGNDYFGARYYASSMGRFLSPDPSGLVYADQTNPQTFNLYSYVTNNPLIFTDPTGLYCYWDDGSSDDDPKDGGFTKAQCLAKGVGGNWTDQTNPCNGADGCTTTTANNPKPMDTSDFFDYMNQWKAGTLSNNIVYLQNSGWTNELRKSSGVQAGIKKYASGGCRDSSQLGTHGPFTGVTTNLAQAETGNFDMSSSTSGNMVTFTVTNTSGQASWSGAHDTQGGKGIWPLNSEGTKDNPHGPNGPRHNVNQTFVWSQPNPCTNGASK